MDRLNMFMYVKADLEKLAVALGHIIYEDDNSPLTDDFLECVEAYKTKNIQLANKIIAKHRKSGILPMPISLASDNYNSFAFEIR